jgi:hypothetical protein
MGTIRWIIYQRSTKLQSKLHLNIIISIKNFKILKIGGLQTINMSGASYAYPVPEKKMDKFQLGILVSEEFKRNLTGD